MNAIFGLALPPIFAVTRFRSGQSGNSLLSSFRLQSNETTSCSRPQSIQYEPTGFANLVFDPPDSRVLDSKCVLDNLPDVVCTLDRTGQIKYINRSVRSSWGFEP